LGSANAHIVEHFRTVCGIRYCATRHENAAVSAADAYARMTNTVGVATVTEGPGVTNSATALVEARKGGTPLVLIAGDSAGGRVSSNLHLEQVPFFEGLEIPALRIEDPAAAVDQLSDAFRRAYQESRPVAVCLPRDVQPKPASEAALARVRPPQRDRPIPPAAGIEKAVQLIAAAEGPLVLGGRGAIRSGAAPALISLADRIGALLATSGQALGLFAGHPFYLGFCGGFSTELAAEQIRQADLVLAFGASLNNWTTRAGELLEQHPALVHCELDGEAIGRITPVSLDLPGDATATAEALLAALKGAGIEPSGWRSAELAGSIASYRRADHYQDESGEGWVDPRAVCIELDRMLPKERSLVLDSGFFLGHPALYMSVPDAAGWVFAQDFQAMGIGLGMTMGAAVARPDRLAVGVIGDGGGIAALGEIQAAVYQQVPMLIVVLNDAAYGMELRLFEMLRQESDLPRLGDIDFAGAARALGADGVTVRSVEDLTRLRPWLDERPPKPMVLDCKIPSRLKTSWFDECMGPGSWMQRANARAGQTSH
ncbi:MAG: thiamine pyrophosphate-binding protein, partial [Chloroflexi bacterium]|nr:thiamine pyrophosphate-binding protein [Chloroflexota bacterium]